MCELVAAPPTVPTFTLGVSGPELARGWDGPGSGGRPGPFLFPCPCWACFSPSHSHSGRTLAVGDATALMGGQVRGGLEKGGFNVQGLVSVGI